MDRICIVAALMLIAVAAYSQENLKYVDAAAFPVYGKAVDETFDRYGRLPGYLQGKVRGPVWNLGRNSAGLFIRFRSNSTSVSAKWTSLSKVYMNHMSPVGTRGIDLYILHDGEWRFAGAGKPQDRSTEAVLVSGMEQTDREYMLYLSLYDGIEDIEIGVDSEAYIGQPRIGSPSAQKPVVMYGTSILQGGCVSRPGMAFTNMIARKLDRVVINLGFSGNALLDYVPNASAKQIAERGETFFRILRDAHPDVPVIFIEDPQFPHTLFNKRIAEEVDRKNKEQKALYDRLRRQGFRKLYYITSENLIGDDGEATVDAIHFTDLGASRYASKVIPVIRKALRKCR